MPSVTRLAALALMIAMSAIPLAGAAYLSYSFWTGWLLRDWAPAWRGLVAGGIFLVAFGLGEAYITRTISKLGGSRSGRNTGLLLLVLLVGCATPPTYRWSSEQGRACVSTCKSQFYQCQSKCFGSDGCNASCARAEWYCAGACPDVKVEFPQ